MSRSHPAANRSATATLLLAGFFGPLGLIYLRRITGICWLFVAAVAVLLAGWFTLPVIWSVCVIDAYLSMRSRSRKIEESPIHAYARAQANMAEATTKPTPKPKQGEQPFGRLALAQAVMEQSRAEYQRAKTEYERAHAELQAAEADFEHMSAEPLAADQLHAHVRFDDKSEVTDVRAKMMIARDITRSLQGVARRHRDTNAPVH